MRRHTRYLSSLALILSLTWAASAYAERCIGPKDNSSAATNRGVDPIAAEDIVWCDDFDSYCEANRLVASIWPGYPPTPDNLCGTLDTASTQWFQNAVHWPKNYTGTRIEVTTGPSRWEGWDGNPGWTTTPYNVVYSGFGNTAQYHTFNLAGAITHAFGEGFDTINGTDENPLVLRYWMYHSLGVGGAPISPLYVELKLDDDRAPTDYVEKDCLSYNDCTCALLHQDASCETGTCAGASCRQWYCGDDDTCEGGPRNGQPCVLSSDCLKTCDTGGPVWPTCSTDADCKVCEGGPSSGQACATNADCGGCVGGAVPGTKCATDFDCQFPCAPEDQAVCDTGPKQGQDCTFDADCAGGPIYPIVNQQWLNGQIATPHPPLDTARTWQSIAFGMLAQTDRNPCDPGTGIKPTQYHACTFDGNRWWDLRSNVKPGNGGDFNYDEGQAFFEIKVKSFTFEVKLIAGFVNNQYVMSTATLDRKYLGPFNKISMGTGPGCKLDPETGECLTEPDVWRYPQVWGSGTGWHVGYIDRPALLGGVPGSAMGACCLPNGTCVDNGDSAACSQAGGVFRGMGTVCDANTCLGACCTGYNCTDTLMNECSKIFLGIGTSCATEECPCSNPFADADGDGDVDQADFAAFQACYTGAGGTLAVGCACFDTHPAGGDNDIDSDDWAAFEACASGAGVPVDPACDGTP